MAQPIDRVVAANYPPLMITGDPARPGYAIEVLRSAATRAGRDIDLSFLPFTRALTEVRQGPATLMPALFFGKEPSSEFLWLAEIQVARLSLATLSGSVNDLETARRLSAIVVEQDTTADVFLTGKGFDNLVRVSAPEASARMLQAGRADAWLLDQTLTRMVWRQLQFPEPLTFGEPLIEVPIFLVASTGLLEEVAQGYQQAIDAMRTDGTLDALWRKYTGG